MKNWKRLTALLLSGAMALSLFACNSDPTNQTTNGDPSDSPSLSLDPDASADPEIVADLSQSALEFACGISPTETLLTINGEDIQADLVLYMLDLACSQTNQYMAYFGATLADMPDMAGGLLQQGIDWTTSYVLIHQKAVELGCLLTDAQNEEIRQAIAEADMDTQAPYWDLTEPTTQFIFELDAYSDNLYDVLTHDPSDEELNDYYYRVKHILIKTVDDNNQPLSDEEIAEKKTQAEDLLAQLQAAEDLPTLFDQLMNEHSEDGRDADGNLGSPDGYLASPGQMVPEFEAASLALAEGEISGLVESTYGYHIILRLPLNFSGEERAQYAEDYRFSDMDNQISQWMEAAEVTQADALTNLNAIDFFTRLSAYQQALYESQNPVESEPVESGGVG